MSRCNPKLSLIVPLAAAVLLGACSAAADSQAAQATTPPTSGNAHSTAALTDAASDEGLDADMDMDQDMDLDADDYDPAQHLRQQLARQPAARGSGGPVQACELSGRIQIMGTSEDVRDCMQSNGKYSVAEFRKACQGLANALVGGGNAAANIQYLGRCPTPAQGSCHNVLNTGLDGYYYQRGSDNLAALPASCTGAGGTWKPAR